MRRFAIAAAVLALLAAPLPSRAQDGAAADPTVGSAVPFVGQEGGEVARITVEEVTDPFEGYDDYYAPQRGSHYLLVRFAIENTGNRPLSLDPSTFAVQDADGFLAFPASITLQEDAAASTPLLEYGDIEAGATLDGAAVFQVFNGVDPIRVVYQPSRDRLLILADLRADGGAAAAVTEPATTAAPVASDLAGAEATATEPAATDAGEATEPGSFAVLLVANDCPPGTPLPDIQVTPCPPVTGGFAVTLDGADGARTEADLSTRQGRQAWTAVPSGDYVLTFTSLPDGHDAYYVVGDGAEASARALGEAGVPVTIGPGAASGNGPLELQVFFVDAG